MGRLIDEDNVRALLVKHHFDKGKENFDMLIHNLCKELQQIPTAYDVDAVVERLEDRKSLMLETFKISESDIDRGRIYGMDKAIEIVKGWGVDD